MFDVSNSDLYNSMKIAYANGGQIFYDRVPSGSTGATATGTSAARVSISAAYLVPSAARELIAISPVLATTAEAAADSMMAFADIQGSNFRRQPQQVPAPVGSVVLSVGAARFTPQEWWTVRAPVVAGDSYDVGITSLIANAHNMKAAMDIMYSTVPTGLSSIYSAIQTTATGFKSAGANSTGTLSLVNAHELYEVGTLVSPETAAVAQEVQILDTQLQCSALTPVQSFNYGVDTPAQIAATSGDTQVPQISRHLAMGGKFTVPNPTLNYTSILTTATTNNLSVAHFARWV